MKREQNILVFSPSTEIIFYENDATVLPHNKILYFKAFYREGVLFTNLGNPVKTLKYIDTSMDLILLEPNSRVPIIDTHPHTILLDNLGINHNQIIPAFNCHGHCFGDSLYWISDPSQILKDEYVQCNEREADIVIYFNGYEIIHSAKTINGEYIAKSGYRGITVSDSVTGNIPDDLTFDNFIFFKKK